MKARIGVAESSKVIEIEVDDADGLRSTAEEALAAGTGMLWLTDTKQRTVGVPVARIAYVEIESSESARAVGFAP